MAEKKPTAEAATPEPERKWLERRPVPLPEGTVSMGVVSYEYRITTAKDAPSPNARPAPDHWEETDGFVPGRTWLAGATPDGG